MTLPDPSLPDLDQLAAELLAPNADLAPRSRINIRRRAGYYLDFSRRHGLSDDLADIEPARPRRD